MDIAEEAKQKIIDALKANNSGITLESPIRITFRYTSELAGHEYDDEANALGVYYHKYAEEYYVTTDEEYYGDINLDTLWASSLQAIASTL